MWEFNQPNNLEIIQNEVTEWKEADNEILNTDLKSVIKG